MKFDKSTRLQVKNIVSIYALRRFTNEEIKREIFDMTKEDVTIRYIDQVKKRIKKDARKWYIDLRESENEYLAEFKQRVDEILWLQRQHYEIIAKAKRYPIKQASLTELHRLNITLSNYFDVAPEIISSVNKKGTTDEAISKTLETSSA